MKAPDINLSDIPGTYPFLLYYQGNYAESPSFSIVNIVEKNLQLYYKKHVVNKLSYLVIELVQNIERYSAHTLSSEDFSFIFSDREFFHVTTQNMIENKDIEALKFRLDSVNSKHIEELNQEYIDVLKSEEYTSKGAGLGLIDIARKTKNALTYEFKQYSETHSTYKLHIKIPIAETTFSPESDENNRRLINFLHDKFRGNESTLFYSGDFSNNFLHSLLKMMKTVKQTDKIASDSKFQYTLIELTQNIRKHGNPLNETVPGYMCIEWCIQKVCIETSNFISEPHKIKIDSKIKLLNESTPEELQKLSHDALNDFESIGGNGLIDVARFSRPNKIDHAFYTQSDTGITLTVKTCICYE